MVQRDYILRIIEEFGQVLLYLVDLRRNGNYREVLRVIDGTLRKYLGLNLATANSLPAEELVALAHLSLPEQANPALANERLIVLASLLQEQAEVFEADGDEEARDVSRLKALQIFLIVLNNETEPNPRAAAAATELLDQLAAYELPGSTKDLLWRHFERVGAYAEAENWLYHLLEDHEVPGGLIDEGISFYDRLLALPEERLASGDLPREEVESGRLHLLALRERVTD